MDGSSVSVLEPMVVYLSQDHRPATADDPEGPTILRSEGTEFAVPFSVVPAAAELRFGNDGAVEHELFTPAASERRLRVPAAGISRSLRLPPGPARFYCSLHPDETFQVFATRSPYRAVVGEGGTFHIPAVPQGAYTLEIWSPEVAGPVRPVYVSGWDSQPRNVWLDPRLIHR